MYYLVVTFSITYLKVHVHAQTKAILWWLLVAHAVHFAVMPLAGHLSDRFGRRPIYFIGAACACTWGFFAFPMMNSGRNVIIMSAIVIGLVFHGLMYAVQPAAMAEMFPTRMRYSGGRSAIRSPQSSPVRWHRSLLSACSRPTNPRCPSPGTWRLPPR
jgi:MFS family permease